MSELNGSIILASFNKKTFDITKGLYISNRACVDCDNQPA